MNRQEYTHYSSSLSRDMHILVHGHTGVPLIAFPCQDSMCDNWESFGMPDTLADFIDQGQIQLFTVDTVDRESWSDRSGDKAHRAWMQERYYDYIINEALPFIHGINGTGSLPIVTGFSLGATHAFIVFLRRPELFAGVLGCSGCYDAPHFWDDWCNETLYYNSPVHFLPDLPQEHPYIDLYNRKKIVVCVGRGRWEREGQRTAGLLKEIFERKGIHAWVDFWGYDVDHDWPWWRKEIRYFLPWLLS